MKIKNALENSVVNACIVELILNPLYIGCAILVFINPAVYYMIIGEKVLHFGFILPFIDEHSSIGYSLNFCYHTLQIFIVFNATTATNLYYILLINSAFGQHDALKILLQELDLLSKQNDDRCNDQLIKQYIKEISSIHMELIK